MKKTSVMHAGRVVRGAACLAACFALAGAAGAATYYVDASAGDDGADGLSAAHAWRSLVRVNEAKLAPGDVVRFRRGGLWRGVLRPRSGTPQARVTYTTYGTGVKPIIQPSVDLSGAAEWRESEPGIWVTKPRTREIYEKVWSAPDTLRWNPSFQNGYKGTCRMMTEDGVRSVRVTLDKTTTPVKPNFLQLWGPELWNLPRVALLKMRVRASKPFALDNTRIMECSFPFSTTYQGHVAGGRIRSLAWQDVSVLLTQVAEPQKHAPLLHVNLGDTLPEGAYVDIALDGIWRAETQTDKLLDRDIGIFVVDGGAKWGVKRWGLHGTALNGWTPPKHGRWPMSATLVNELDYCYDPEERCVYVKCDGNPGAKFASIELAKTVHAVSEGGCHDVTYDGLWIRYAAAHGFGGGSTANITIRNCDISWIGGGLQYWRKDPKTGAIVCPVRFGNGIEFWGNCANVLVERCRLWEVYDAAVTNQGRNDDETDVIWRDNVIWNSEYSYEYWNARLTRNVVFEHNTCVDAGYGWAHAQRPDINGAHLMYYHNRAATTNFVVCNNVFCRATEWTCRTGIDWRKALVQDHNLVFNDGSIPYLRWLEGKSLLLADWEAYRQLGFETNGLKAEPRFVNPAVRDYRLTPDSPGYAGLSTDGTPVGARNMPGLDGDQSL